ncbi:MAG: hypothetical protein ACLTSX_01205 [Collinsella sp.]
MSYAKKRRSYSSYAGEISAAPDNLVARDFHAEAPNEVAHRHHAVLHPTPAEVYLSPVIDCFDGMPVAVEHRGERTGAGETPCWKSLQAAGGRGIPYATATEAATTDGPDGSASAQSAASSVDVQEGCSPRQLRLRGFFGRLKNEFFYDRDWEE